MAVSQPWCYNSSLNDSGANMRHYLRIMFFLLTVDLLHADTGQDGWLRYAPLPSVARAKYASLPAAVAVFGGSPILDSARDEVIRGVRGMLGRTLRAEKELPKEPAIILTTVASLKSVAPNVTVPKTVKDGFWLGGANLRGNLSW